MVSRGPLISFFVLACGMSWLFWVPYVLGQDGIGILPFHVPKFGGSSMVLGVMPGAFIGPITAAFTVTAVAEGRSGLRTWRARLIHWRTGVRWYGFAVIAIPATLVLSVLLLPGAAAELRLPSATVLMTYAAVVVVQFCTSALAEEPGWRDFALPRLQDRHGPVLGTVVLGLCWAGWHLPLFLTTWGDGAGLLGIAVFIVFCVALSLVITWVFNRTGQSVPVAMLLHAAVNAHSVVLQSAFYPELDVGYTFGGGINAFAMALVALALIAATRGRLGYRLAERSPEPAAPSRIRE
ncbi:type II CAAX endopeptidase family protein [Streptomonospora sediminis]